MCVTQQFISTTDDDYCYEFNGISDCGKLIDEVPSALHSTYALCILTLFVAVFVGLVASTASVRPEYIDSQITATTVTIVQPAQSTPATIITSDYIINPSSNITVQPATSNPIQATAVPVDKR
jgi:ABC-type antimicrobial peptide transport system permease subunit